MDEELADLSIKVADWEAFANFKCYSRWNDWFVGTNKKFAL